MAPAQRIPAPHRIAVRPGAGWAGALAALAIVALASVCAGATFVSPGTVLDALLHYDPARLDELAVRTLRLPRTLVGLAAGAGLGLAGAILQSSVRNPLADPGILGINAGAALAIVLGLTTMGSLTGSSTAWLALAGAAIAAAVVHLLAHRSRGPVTLLLAGTALTAILTSATSAVLLTDGGTFAQFRFWQVGSLTGRPVSVLLFGAALLVPALGCGLLLGRALNVQALGEDLAISLGQRSAPAKLLSSAVVVVLSGVATAIAGPIGFLGLLVPHLARLITGPDQRWVLRYSVVLGPLLLLLADLLGRFAAGPAELPAGVVTAVFGTPVLIVLARRKKLSAA
ncbi:iron ABC transporter permease [Amycolatopsis rubida]|uniref:Iron ABC transporter permease n=1 Tax=Amycolatopsis rubida TaxID=112413 RepID=A0A1I5IMK5_9PSEU|nr:iron ABC transporter permease [Amycolatopsis rubida]MYW97323.1 iron chelate uptake ABC transporter family permease subunit [Amycolatopsis rubida]NEC62308.1 iron ABC transporter permease [Amycolatopsis rubida]OAP20667.1 putative siderophore transport system permease protein YfiZ precursor [Amycolatopsis sp. M39]SFO61845.1 iron complex transport system permease protein [Amycolatopsis rubida]